MTHRPSRFGDWVLVALALDAEMVGNGYGQFDLRQSGQRIEVKAAGDVQSWPQRVPSPISFGISPAVGYIKRPDGSQRTDPARRRRSDADVFCHHVGAVPDGPDEWTFYVVPTKQIDKVLGAQKTIRLGPLVKLLRPRVVDFGHLREGVDEALGLTPSTTRQAPHPFG